jgi:hypothetical protein
MPSGHDRGIGSGYSGNTERAAALQHRITVDYSAG